MKNVTNTKLIDWFYPFANRLAKKLGQKEWHGRVPILVEEAWLHQQKKLDHCIAALESIGVVVDGEVDSRDSIEALIKRWESRDKEKLIETMAEDTIICRRALEKIGALKGEVG